MSTGRIIALIAASFATLLAITLLGVGGLMLWLHEAKRDDDGYYTSRIAGLETPAYAVTSEGLTVADVPDWLFKDGNLADARLVVSGADAEQRLFVGVAPALEARAHLAGVDRALVHDADLRGKLDDIGVKLDYRAGGAPSAPPGEQDFWLASVEGSGT